MDADHDNETALLFAQALFVRAREKKETTTTLEAAERLAQVYGESRDFRRFASHPRFDHASVKRVLTALDKKLALGGVLMKILLLLARTRNLALFPKVCKRLRTLVAEERGEIKAHIVSAKALSASERRAVETALRTRLAQEPQSETTTSPKALPKKSTLSLVLSFAEDPALLSGLVITLRSRMIDLSLRSELRRLRKALARVEQAA